jgi:hypothetical protein
MSQCPDTIKGRIIEIEQMTQSEVELTDLCCLC